ncbi:Peptidoglycan/xylan/chitin deacetylase, PgdA/CDA1 family [Pseudobutyrivibrio ruminis]|uniref:Peptidoglycan/xylan/chitin deacetylase, PgdA/CDA1 family n=1 Tax=Pseudobutyrivibrio ruminis TaxID=46206 RepID=A0A1H7IFD9_9FIRM|nr:polysaccharide deacetylase family protein [Pseudobutyrivibrio ruminis]SEK60477.1 Peptidoglycan/xylan/chitin deacetylase, PgdA/CDA1 family [Pseudobutyrivibrio ruminis]
MESSFEGLERQRAKRRRVARMKKFIVTTVLVFMLLTISVMSFLLFEVFSLQRQLDSLAKQVYVTTDVENESEMVDDSILDDVYQVDNVDNIAEEGDIPMVYLTFDDGPSSNTDEILDILDDYNVKATFFVCGKDLELYGEQYKRIVDEGHTIGMHSYSHNFGEIYASEDAFAQDYNKIHNLILETTGVDTKYYRFPGGSSNKVSTTSMSTFINYLNNQGVVYYDWNVASGDATSSAFTTEQLIDNVMKDVVKYKTSVVLLHDASNKNATVEALPGLIESLQEQGAMILPITDETTVIQHVNVVQ